MAARCLLALPDTMRRLKARRLLREAQTADLHRLSTGRPHRHWGNGSLMAAAARYPRVAEPDFGDADYCRCWMLVFEELLRFRQSTPQT